MNELRRGEIARLKRVLDELQVRPDLGYRERVAVFHFERYPTAIRQDVEPVCGHILIDTHRHLAARLQRGE